MTSRFGGFIIGVLAFLIIVAFCLGYLGTVDGMSPTPYGPTVGVVRKEQAGEGCRVLFSDHVVRWSRSYCVLEPGDSLQVAR